MLKNTRHFPARFTPDGNNDLTFSYINITLPREDSFSSDSVDDASLREPSLLYPRLSNKSPATLSKDDGSDDVLSVRLVERTSGRGVRVVLVGLRPFTRYALTARAYNGQGAGPSTPAITTITKEAGEYH